MRSAKKTVFIFFTVFLSSIFISSPLYSIELTSSAFEDKEMIPGRYSGLGFNMSPPLAWEDIPEGTRSLVLTVEDPDAPGGNWIHWVVYDIPPSVSSLREGQPRRNVLPSGIKQGRNSFGTVGYGGPFPPPGPPHRYVFTLYALDNRPGIPPGSTLQFVKDSIQGHVLERTTLTGLYER